MATLLMPFMAADEHLSLFGDITVTNIAYRRGLIR
jgi:hypothetical protein